MLGFIGEKEIFPDSFTAHLTYRKLGLGNYNTAHWSHLCMSSPKVIGARLQVTLLPQLTSRVLYWESALPPTKTHVAGHSRSQGRGFALLAIKYVHTHSPVCT